MHTIYPGNFVWLIRTRRANAAIVIPPVRNAATNAIRCARRINARVKLTH